MNHHTSLSLFKPKSSGSEYGKCQLTRLTLIPTSCLTLPNSFSLLRLSSQL
ncbi:DEHA2D12144p [Debaryomyces hansenii CBS767]|uniref:DEHA2D12144p n=1 Tax=Debaryomyces hansenii (strain ATCC 36239 / CBS 767 / BCRC 21394 / JCM 1990 / NBRC 0083 / IGC 2968) TaxID=284592 RepID=Q6BS22_DEBHA|nr:DEHA2D12144p [Debaryomyces hansenii CBS767]CAG87166.2 DEHA2D12144p [Debaryomyces hansenii CBS767]|eukprot:XP_458998.2 DEHA2D12144p [Debaryomyces hansenii CBS767]